GKAVSKQKGTGTGTRQGQGQRNIDRDALNMSISKLIRNEGGIIFDTKLKSGIFTYGLEETTKGIAVILHHASILAPVGLLVQLLQKEEENKIIQSIAELDKQTLMKR
ncbi:MAG: hypothetical protein EZS28_049884, partial [Streblomastix strix]